MIFRQFLVWTKTADAASRAEGASALARAYLESELSDEARADAEIALTSLLDDPSPAVRRAMAVELAASPFAPRHIITALAADQSDISVPVLSRSPLLSDAELIECAAIGDVYAQAAIALRPALSEAVAFSIAENGEREAAISLSVNLTAEASERVLRKILQRHGDDGEVREAMLARGDLPASIRSDLVTATADALSAFVARTGWMAAARMERTCREARESGVIEIAAAESPGDSVDMNAPLELVHHLRQHSQLTPALILRGLVSGNRSLLTATLCELTALDPARVAGFVTAWSGAGFGALYARANLPPALLPVSRAALAAQDEYGLIYAAGRRPQLSRLLIEKTLRALDEMAGPDLGRVISVLNNFRVEALRAEARVISSQFIAAAGTPEVKIPEMFPADPEWQAPGSELAVAA